MIEKKEGGYVVSFGCTECNDIVWVDTWVQKNGNILLALGECCDGQEFLINLKLQYRINNKVMIKRFVHELTAERIADYNACVEQQAA